MIVHSLREIIREFCLDPRSKPLDLPFDGRKESKFYVNTYPVSSVMPIKIIVDCLSSKPIVFAPLCSTHSVASTLYGLGAILGSS